MPTDPLRDLAALERELRREEERPVVWDAVVRGEVDPSVAARSLPGEMSPTQIAVDEALFRPPSGAQRERWIGQMLARTERQSMPASRRRTLRNSAIALGLAAAVALIVIRTPRPGDDTVIPWSSHADFSVEVVGGVASIRGDASLASIGRRNLPIDREFRVQVRIGAHGFAIHKVVAHCGPHVVELPFTPILTEPGFVEVEARPSARTEGACEIEVQVREGSQVFSLPRTQAEQVEFVTTP